MLTSGEWHDRFVRQARWTRDLRRHLLERAGSPGARQVLEVGCGTGAVLTELAAVYPHTHGLDIDLAHLERASVHAPQAPLTLGDAHRLPYASSNFDLTICHFLLLWVSDPLVVVSEMARVTRAGGSVLALAEPDYGGRIDYPYELVALGQLQIQSLRRQGADPLIGRRLRGIFHRAGLENVEAGLLGGQWRGPSERLEWLSEWQVLESDLKEMLSPSELSDFREKDASAWSAGERILFVPTFYAWGRKP
jgi:ubiquinone/menaquinone biosynthesis C-methylase UbiE